MPLSSKCSKWEQYCLFTVNLSVNYLENLRERDRRNQASDDEVLPRVKRYGPVDKLVRSRQRKGRNETARFDGVQKVGRMTKSPRIKHVQTICICCCCPSQRLLSSFLFCLFYSALINFGHRLTFVPIQRCRSWSNRCSISTKFENFRSFAGSENARTTTPGARTPLSGKINRN